LQFRNHRLLFSLFRFRFGNPTVPDFQPLAGETR
jgi:hypothetical protein